MKETSKKAIYLRNFVFGVEDSLVSTVGFLSGVAVIDTPRATIFLAGVTLIFVEAFSMAAGSFLSEYSTEDYIEKREVPPQKPLSGSLVMFFSYLLSGFIPLTPYFLFKTQTAFGISIIASLLALFGLSLISAKISRTKIFKTVIRMLSIGGVAILAGIIVGKLASQIEF